MKKFIFLLFLLFSFSPVYAQKDQNAGFIPSGIWYSKNPFFAGENIRIYTSLFNCKDKTLNGTLTFYDNGIKINSVDFSLPDNCQAQILSIKWKAKEGKHIITAKITKAELKDANGNTEPITLKYYQTKESVKEIDTDTDKDGLGDKIDKDDDNDGISDEDEIKNKTDPKNPDTDGDGIKDKEDNDPLKPFTKTETKNKNSQTKTKETKTSEQLKELVSEKIIPQTSSTTKNIIKNIETFRKETAKKLANIKENQKEKKDQPKKTEEKDKIQIEKYSVLDAPKIKDEKEKTLPDAFSFVTNIFYYIFNSIFLFYLFGAVFIYFSIKIFFKIIKKLFKK